MIRKRGKIISPVKQKILLLLSMWIALSFTRSIGKQIRILSDLPREWRNINRQYLIRILREFRHERMISWKETSGGKVRITLTERGKRKLLEFDIDAISIRNMKRWDKKWRMVAFDVPEKMRSARDALREKLKKIGFLEMHRSVFIHPFPCKKEIEFVVEFFELRKYVRHGELTLENDSDFRLAFGLY